MSPTSSPSRAALLSRVAASLLGSYLFVWGFVTLLVTLQVQVGVSYAEALTLADLLAFVVFLGVFLWSYAARSVLRLWSVLAGGGGVMTGAAWWLTRGLA